MPSTHDRRLPHRANLGEGRALAPPGVAGGPGRAGCLGSAQPRLLTGCPSPSGLPSLPIPLTHGPFSFSPLLWLLPPLSLLSVLFSLPPPPTVVYF